MSRSCGSCTLCCKLLPVVELKKLAGERCINQRGLGCRIYRAPRLPISCKLWSCQWLMDADTINMSRPDQVHYVIDVTPDYVDARDNETGAMKRIPVLQIWVDPDYPDAHRDPALRDYLAMRGARDGVAALVRYDSSKAVALLPPSMVQERQFREVSDGTIDPKHDAMRAIKSITLQFASDD